MRTVEIDLRPSELSGEMAAMRVWLDERRFEPSSFTCYPNGLGVLVRMDFKVAREAEWFAQRFGGRVNEVLTVEAEAQLARRISRTDLSPHGVVG